MCARDGLHVDDSEVRLCGLRGSRDHPAAATHVHAQGGRCSPPLSYCLGTSEKDVHACMRACMRAPLCVYACARMKAGVVPDQPAASGAVCRGLSCRCARVCSCRWELSLTSLQRQVLFAAASWRDSVCRELDEGTGYVLPRSQLITLAQQMPGDWLV